MKAPTTADRIVDAAERCLNDADPGKLTVERVASTLGVHRATLYRQFPGGREEILTAVISRIARKFMKKLARHVDREPRLADKIVEALVFTVEETFKHPTLSLLFAPDTAGRTGAAAAGSRAIQEIVKEMWGPRVADAQARAECRDDLVLDELVELLLRLIFSLVLNGSPAARSRVETKSFLRNVIAPFVAVVETAPTGPSGSTGPTGATGEPRPERTPPLPPEHSDRPMAPAVDVRAVSDRMLEAAADLFREKGYRQASTRDLAQRLGISQPSLYHHFRSKEELLEGVCLEGIRRVNNALITVLSDGGSVTHELIHAYLHSLICNRNLHLTRVLESSALGPEHLAVVHAKEKSCEDLLRSAIRREREAGTLRRDMDEDHLVQALLNLLNWSLFHLGGANERAIEEAADALARIYLEGARVARQMRRQSGFPSSPSSESA